MIESPKMLQAESINAAVIHRQLLREEIQTAIEPAINDLMAQIFDSS